jgi:hypothetical protein
MGSESVVMGEADIGLCVKLAAQAVQLSDCPSSCKGEGVGDKEPCVVGERLKVGEAFFVGKGVVGVGWRMYKIFSIAE